MRLSPGMEFGLTRFWVGWLLAVGRFFGGEGEDFGVFWSGRGSTGECGDVSGRWFLL